MDSADDETAVESMAVESPVVVIDVALRNCDEGLRSLCDELRSRPHRMPANYHSTLEIRDRLQSGVPKTIKEKELNI